MNPRLLSCRIGICDMLFSVLDLVGTVVFFALLIASRQELLRQIEAQITNGAAKEEKKTLSDVAITAILCVGFVIACSARLLQMYGAWKLIEGTKQDISSSDALRFCRTWKNITIFFTVIQVLSSVQFAGWFGDKIQLGPNILVIILHVLALLYVSKYMESLRNFNALQTTATINSVGVGHQAVSPACLGKKPVDIKHNRKMSIQRNVLK